MALHEVLADCAKLVRGYEQWLSELCEQHGVGSDFRALALKSAFRFGPRSLEAMSLLLERGHFGLLAARNLLRAFCHCLPVEHMKEQLDLVEAEVVKLWSGVSPLSERPE